MGKSAKRKKNKVPKITEEEYANYLSSLKEQGQVCDEIKKVPSPKEMEPCKT